MLLAYKTAGEALPECHNHAALQGILRIVFEVEDGVLACGLVLFRVQEWIHGRATDPCQL